MHRGFLLLSLAALGCSASSPPPVSEPAPPASAVPAIASANAAPSSTAVAEAPKAAAPSAPPRAGTERRGYTLFRNAKKDPAQSLPIAIDVPATWGSSVDGTGDPEFLDCRLEERILGKLSVGLASCREGDSDADCIDKRMQSNINNKRPGEVHRITAGSDRAWGEFEQGTGFDHSVHVDFAAVDAKTRYVVYCSAILTGNDIELVSEYRAACESIILRPTGVAAASLEPTTPRPDPNATKDPPSPMADAARSFVVAMSKRDEKAAAVFLPDASLCKKRPAGEQQKCKEYVQKQRGALKTLFPQFPADFEPGNITVKPAPGMPGLFSIHVHSRKDECSEGIHVTMSEVDGKPSVMFAMRVEEKTTK